MAEQAAKEPTMEEILASIRRIISEDGEPDTGISRSAPAAVAGNDDDDIVFDDDDADFPDDIDDFENVANDLAGAAPNGTDHHLSLDDLLGDDSDLAMSGHEQPGVAPSTAPSPKIQPFPQQARTETDMPATQRYQDMAQSHARDGVARVDSKRFEAVGPGSIGMALELQGATRVAVGCREIGAEPERPNANG